MPVDGPGEERCYIFNIIFVFHPNIYNTAKNSKWKHHTSQGQRRGVNSELIAETGASLSHSTKDSSFTMSI